MRKLSFLTMLVLIMALFVSQVGALEFGASLWLPDGFFKSETQSFFDSEQNGQLKVLTAPGSPIGIGPVALVSETSLGTNQNISGLKAMFNDKNGEGFFFADFLAGVRMSLPIKLFGISAQGLVSYGATGFGNLMFENENSNYFASLYWGPRFRGQLKAEILGKLLTAVASYEFAPELKGLRKTATIEGEEPDEAISSATLTNYRVGLEGHIPFATIGAGYRVLKLDDASGGYTSDFSGYYAEARLGF